MDCDIVKLPDSESDQDISSANKVNKFNVYVEELIEKGMLLVPQENRTTLSLSQLNLNDDCRAKHLAEVLLCILRYAKSSGPLNKDTFLSLNESKIMKSVTETVVFFGILSCLLPGVGTIAKKKRAKSFRFYNEKNSEDEKYELLASTVRVLTDRFKDLEMRPVLLPQLDLILAALLQLSYVPLRKPQSFCTTETSKTKQSSETFEMTKEMYQSLLKDQQEFQTRLRSLTESCPKEMVLRELMVIHGAADVPKWIQRRTQMLLKNAILTNNGTFALFQAVCGDDIDLGIHWEKLDTVTKLIVGICTSDIENSKTICSQLIDLAESDKQHPASTFAKRCIIDLHENNPNIVYEKIIRTIAAPLLPFNSTNSKETSEIIRKEEEITYCIDRLTSYFNPRDATFNLSFDLIKIIAVPLFCLHLKAQGSVVSLKTKVKHLLTDILKESTSRHEIFKAFLHHDGYSHDFGAELFCRFGGSGGLEITNEKPNIAPEIANDGLLDLVSSDESLAFDLFVYFLRLFSRNQDKDKNLENLTPDNASFHTENRGENRELESLVKRMEYVRILSNLSESRAIREGLVKNPEPLVSLVKSLFDERLEESVDSSRFEAINDALFTSLMLVKAIATTDCSVSRDWKPLDRLAAFLRSIKDSKKLELQSRFIIEAAESIENRGRSKFPRKRYQDLNLNDRKNESNFSKALNDLADPLLPVRAHGLMSMTKLIESEDPETIAKKDIALCFFHENLKNEDSFIYLAAINGLCALSLKFPEKVVEILVQEFIDMPLRDNSDGEISVETRVKLGEILVKATRGLGEMAAVYKEILINGFLCGVRDSDDTIRASSLSCLGELCKVLGFRLGDATIEIFYCINCIIESDKAPECRRAAVLVANLLIRGLGKDVLTNLGQNLVDLYRILKFLRDRDDDQVLQLHVQLALEELDEIVHSQL